jgi:hypothetical protein
MSTKSTLAIIAALILAAAGAYFWFGQAGVTTAAEQANSGTVTHLTLDPNLFKGQVKEAYEIAGRDPALLAQLHCYCGCDKTEGHKNLLDCFRDKHGSTCAICVGEAREADVLARQGMPVEQIRDSLRTRYGKED